jgi:NCS1 family nucleobase:cation symporter-1
MIPFFCVGLYTGRVAVALSGPDMALLVDLPVAAVLYIHILACRPMDLGAGRRRAEAADVGFK